MVERNEVVSIIESYAPLDTQEAWDNSGWQVRLVNDEVDKVDKVLVSLEVSEDVVDEAIELGAKLIICHHPLLFRGIQSVDQKTVTGNMICKLIQNGISIYATHTPFDKCSGGNNDYLAKLIGLENIEIIAGDDTQICRMGTLKEERSVGQLLRDFAKHAGQNVSDYRLVGKGNPEERLVRTIGMCTGAGAEFSGVAAAAGCELYLTGDVKYHEAQQFLENDMIVADLGHFGSEQIFTENMARILAGGLIGQPVEIIRSKVNLNPFHSMK